MTTDTATSEADARAFLQAAGIETGTDAECRAAYRKNRSTPNHEDVPRVPLRLTGGPVSGSVTVSGWQAKGTRPILAELADVEAAARAAGWDVVRLTPDSLRLDPPHVAAHVAAVERARRRAQLATRAENLRAALTAVLAELDSLPAD